ncbi:shock factor protein 3 [Seminavis robusta]|uniref:Shock factor protein 3 n=1 Tax=Seminavis robusta TaxID=568900 RepID=A0A9N8D9J9_9STRA|nr:shock factor protein 3 [Seminavis robusta]|eukprot:Sro24_g016590.1 shock factor protein 3 (358) ;mRNA; f:150687-151964
MDSKGKIPYELLLNKKGRARLPDKLMDHLNNEELNEVIWWLPDGASFAMDSKTVQESFLDVHFRGTKLTSFIRSLNRWGFRRVFFHAMPRNAICFQSPKFKKGEPQLLKEMKLAPTGSGGASKPPFIPDRGHIGASASAAAASSSSQVDVLFGQDIGAQSGISGVASLPGSSVGATGLSSLQNMSGVLGHQSRGGLASPGPLNLSLGGHNHLQQLQSSLQPNAGAPGAAGNRDQALLAAMQRGDLFNQLQIQQHLQQQQQQHHQQQQQQNRDLQYVQSLFPPSAATAAGAGLPQGFLASQGLSQGGAPSSIYAAAAARQRQSEFKQADDPPGNREEEDPDAALLSLLRRQNNNGHDP